MITPDEWPFAQGPHVAAFSDARVLAGAPILLVVHYSDDHSWAFLSGEELSADEGKLIGMGTALQLDPTLRSIADLPPGWAASRSAVGDPWVREENPDG
jgi:hypothetical protein